jgi:hypothetical protein
MIMKKANFLLVAIIFSLQATAQFSAGVKGGVNFSKEKYKNGIYTTSTHTFFTGGIFGNYSFSKYIAAQLEANYSAEGTDEEYMANGTKVTGTVTINRINIPLLLQLKPTQGFYIATGPQIGFLLSAKGKYTTGNYDFKANTNSTLFSWCFGAGYTLSKGLPGLGIDVRYAVGLNNVDKGATSAQSIKANTISLTLFYAFVHCKKK